MFQRRSKLHVTEGRVQLEVFEKLTSVCFFQIALETILLDLLVIYIIMNSLQNYTEQSPKLM